MNAIFFTNCCWLIVLSIVSILFITRSRQCCKRKTAIVNCSLKHNPYWSWCGCWWWLAKWFIGTLFGCVIETCSRIVSTPGLKWDHTNTSTSASIESRTHWNHSFLLWFVSFSSQSFDILASFVVVVVKWLNILPFCIITGILSTSYMKIWTKNKIITNVETNRLWICITLLNELSNVSANSSPSLSYVLNCVMERVVAVDGHKWMSLMGSECILNVGKNETNTHITITRLTDSTYQIGANISNVLCLFGWFPTAFESFFLSFVFLVCCIFTTPNRSTRETVTTPSPKVNKRERKRKR